MLALLLTNIAYHRIKLRNCTILTCVEFLLGPLAKLSTRRRLNDDGNSRAGRFITGRPDALLKSALNFSKLLKIT